MATQNIQAAQPENLLNGKYKLISRLASGSMATVYLASDASSNDRLLALKLLSSDMASDPVNIQRFEDEFRASFEIRHPNVLRSYDLFYDAGVLGLALEYAERGDLGTLIENEDEMSFSKIVGILVQICEGLSVIHSAGIVHRDVKPENILIANDGSIKISDFGIALLDGRHRKTEDGVLLGGLDYLSPEYIERGEVDPRGDIYAMGMIAYKMIAKHLPTEGKSFVESLVMRCQTGLPAPSTFRSGCPATLDAIVCRCIERSLDKRYQSARDVLSDLYALEASLSISTDTLSELTVLQETAESARKKIKKKPVVAKLTPLELVSDYHYSSEEYAAVKISELTEVDLSDGNSFSNSVKFSAFLLTCLIGLIAIYLPPQGSNIKYKTSVPKQSVNMEDRSAKSAVLRVDSDYVVHVVRYPGETLSGLSQWYTGSLYNWSKIAEHNPDLDVNRIELGAEIKIPRSLVQNETPFVRN